MKKKITVIGNGFASLFFIQYLLALPTYPFFAFFFRKLFSRYEVTLIGTGKFIYFPAIPDFIIGTKNTKGITTDIRPYLRRRNIRFIEDEVIDIQEGGRKVITRGGEYENDALFVGIGPAFEKDAIPGMAEHSYSPCDGPERMDEFMSRLNAMDEGIIYCGFTINRRDKFVSGRAGQMYECACLLDLALKERGVRDKFEIHFFSPALDPDDKGPITQRMEERGVILEYGFAPAEFTAEGMKNAEGEFHKADLVLFSPGIIAPPLAENSCLPVTPGGLIEVDEFGQVAGLENVFSSGDCAAHANPPPWIPHQAHMAQMRSEAAAKNLRAVLRGEAPTHTYRFELSCILNMGNDAMWMHRASDDKPPFRGIFPKRSPFLMRVKNSFEGIYQLYLKYL